jgi:hypothetical protein
MRNFERVPDLEVREAAGTGQLEARDLVERGGLLLVGPPAFEPTDDERVFLSAEWSDGVAKNISFDPGDGGLTGARGDRSALAALARMLDRFAVWSEALVERLLGYAELERARTSLRPVEAEGRATGWRSDDRLLHVDAFPSRPTGGRRILRVFANVHPRGRPRVWQIGPTFESIVVRYVARLRRPAPGAALLAALAGATRGRRSPYDHAMLQLHDLMKSDRELQSNGSLTRVELAPRQAWVLFSDQVCHRALSGQHALEQTFLLPVDALSFPERSPLRVLESALGRVLHAD